MKIGTIVQYRPHPDNEGEPGFPAVVMQEWPDGSVQLYVMQFDHPANIRAAHPTQVEVRIDPDHQSLVQMLVERLLKTATDHEHRLKRIEDAGNVDAGVEPTRDLSDAEIDEAQLVTVGPVDIENTRQQARSPKRWPK